MSPHRGNLVSRAACLLLAAGAVLGGLAARAQTHKVQKPEDVLRAVGVYEWTGDLTKPTANRLVPVTIFANGELRDAGVYLSRPIPFALSPGNEYELERAGVPQGLLDLGYAEHLLGASSTTENRQFDDGWFGYGSLRTLAPPSKKEPVLRAARTTGVITTSRDGKETAGTSKPATSSNSDPDRPTMRRRTTDPGTATATDTKSDNDPTKADTSKPDPDQTSGKPDPERPTLRRRPPDDSKQNKAKSDVATVTARGSITDDPDRPRLHRGNSEGGSGADRNIPKLVGLPADLHQISAVSDAGNRPVHDFSRSWTDEAEHTSVLNKMRGLAAAELAKTKSTNAPGIASSTPRSTRTAAPARTRRSAPAAHAPALTNEDLKAYTLSYGGAPTYVYSAQTTGAPDTARSVTVVAQANIQGDLRPALSNVADLKHLDQTPQIRVLDVVDAEASNRASLLVELRSENARQFALYRLLGAEAEQTFLTGTTQ